MRKGFSDKIFTKIVDGIPNEHYKGKTKRLTKRVTDEIPWENTEGISNGILE